MDGKFLKRLEKELVVTLGCTEPIAIAYAAALAKNYVKGEIVTSVRVLASANVIKNAMSVVIPSTQGSGANLAAALGVVAGDSSKGLEVLTGLTPGDVEKARKMIKDKLVIVGLAESVKKLYIELVVETAHSYARVIIMDEHTKVVLIEVDGLYLVNTLTENKSSESGDMRQEDTFITVDSIWEFVQRVKIVDLDIIKKTIELNTTIGLEGLTNEYGLQVGKTIKESIRKGILTDDLITYAMALMN